MFNDPRTNPMHRRKKFLLLPAITVLLFALSAIVQRLWNSVLPDALHAGSISYWQAMGLLVLCRILFGSFQFKGRGGRPGFGGPGFGGPGRDMREKWAAMSDEERVKFKERFRDRCHNRR